jgi:hypothetical protein
MHQSLSAARSSAARSRLAPIGAAARQRVLIAVVRTPSGLPSLAAGRVAAARRALGDEVRLAEFEGEGLLALPRLGSDTDLLVLVDSEDRIRVFPATDAPGSTSISTLISGAGAGASRLVPDFSDYPFERTRVLPIAAAVGGAPRPLGALLHEVREYVRRHASPDLVFVDRALNRDPALLGGLVDSVQRHAHGVQWMAALRVDDGSSDGLSRRFLRAAAGAGLRSVVLRAPAGAAERRARELAVHAGDAGISTRVVAGDLPVEARPAGLRVRPRAGLGAVLPGPGAEVLMDIAQKDSMRGVNRSFEARV